MKKLLSPVILAGVMIAVLLNTAFANIRQTDVQTAQQTHAPLKQKRHKRHRTTHSQRMQKQLKQADKHLKDEKKVRQTQNEVKKGQ